MPNNRNDNRNWSPHGNQHGGSHRHGGGRGNEGRRDHRGGQETPDFPGYLTTPYNFVPLADEVFIPEWGTPSHDVPFSDAVSGELHLILTAKSPIYVRGTAPKPDGLQERDWENPDPPKTSPFGKWTEFYTNSKTGRYAIPGTTIKGAIRNVLKILSFGSIGHADDDYLSVRDLHDPSYTTEITQERPDLSSRRGKVFEAKVRGGWLSENPDRSPEASEWIITPCAVARVEQHLLGMPLRGTAKQKYQFWDRGNRSLEVSFDLNGEFDGGADVHPHSCGGLFYAKAENLSRGNRRGILVFTGQVGRKHMEFIFHSEESTPVPVSKVAKKKFTDTHPIDNDGWNFWRNTLEKPGGKIPVFWIENSDDSEDRIAALGLAQMFRLPARSLYDAIPATHTGYYGLDVPDRIFGKVGGGDELKGRARFTEFSLCEHQRPDDVRFKNVVKTVLGAPRPTFYPAYLEQPAYQLSDGKRKAGRKADGREIPPKEMAHTWLSPEVRIRGWKRYPVADSTTIRHLNEIQPNGQGRPNYNTATAFRPLQSETCFEGSMPFHNLTRRELGALVWALTWGGDPELRHSLGMGKPLGMGSCNLEIDWEKTHFDWHGKKDSPDGAALKDMDAKGTDANLVRQAFLKACQDAFTADMETFARTELKSRGQGTTWLQTESMRELRILADPKHADKWERYKAFPPLAHFKRVKDGSHVLPRASEIVSGNLVPSELRTLTSGNPPRRKTGDREGRLSSEVSRVVSPPTAPARRQITAPTLPAGKQVEGTLIAEPGKPDGMRLYFSPDGHTGIDGNTGKRIENDLGAVIGQRWLATVQPTPTITYKLVSRLDHD